MPHQHDLQLAGMMGQLGGGGLNNQTYGGTGGGIYYGGIGGLGQYQGTQATANDNAQWIQWNVIYLTNSSIYATDATTQWIQWNSTADNLYRPIGYNPAPVRQPSQAELDLARQQAAERAKAAEEARAKAARLLREFLDEKQKDTLEKHKWFEVVTPKGNRYRIQHGRTGNVYRMERHKDGKQDVAVMRYCIHPEEYVPDEDTMLAQMLMLKTEEDRFEQVANKTRLAA
jgi:hypothetical protein